MKLSWNLAHLWYIQMKSGEGYSVYITLDSDHATYSVKNSEDFEWLIIPYSDFDDNI